MFVLICTKYPDLTNAKNIKREKIRVNKTTKNKYDPQQTNITSEVQAPKPEHVTQIVFGPMFAGDDLPIPNPRQRRNK